MGHTAVHNVHRVDPTLGRIQSARNFGQHAAADRAIGKELIDTPRRQVGKQRPGLVQHTADVGQHHQLFGLQHRRELGSHHIGIDVVTFVVFTKSYGADYWNKSIILQCLDHAGVDANDVTHLADVVFHEMLRGGKKPTVLVSDAVTAASSRVGSLSQMVRLESRAKLLNPKWYEAMLAHGYEGAREIEARVNNTYGWSATTNAVEGWVYQGVAETYVLDEEMRERLAKLNAHAAAGMVRRLLEANGRGFWDADEATLEKLRTIYEDLEDRLEGVSVGQSG